MYSSTKFNVYLIGHRNALDDYMDLEKEIFR